MTKVWTQEVSNQRLDTRNKKFQLEAEGWLMKARDQRLKARVIQKPKKLLNHLAQKKGNILE